MIKNLFHITLITYVWKRYKAIIISTLILFFYFWLIAKLHEDFVSYGHLNDDQQYIGLSFFLKWLGFLTGFIVYFIFNSRFLRSGNRLDSNKASALGVLGTRDNHKNASSDLDGNARQSDPFEAIRNKKRLRSVADFIIEEKGSNSE